jgi:nicotinate-nucleotide pyrophosphorylase (carboxylating)
MNLMLPARAVIEADVARALAEDIGAGDVSAALLDDAADTGYLVAKAAGVLAGAPWFEACFRALDPAVVVEWHALDGDAIAPGQRLATVRGRRRALLSAERTALNFIQTLSGTATTTARHVAAVAGTDCRLLDTRKTLPGLRQAQKYAVRAGGGHNHRMGLDDAVMLKENHLRHAGSIEQAVAAARARWPSLPVIVEVEDLVELDHALASRCDRVLLDDFSPADRREAVRRVAGRMPLEVSGGVTLASLRAIAEDGVDVISIGALTKHVEALDLSFKLGRPHG